MQLIGSLKLLISRDSARKPKLHGAAMLAAILLTICAFSFGVLAEEPIHEAPQQLQAKAINPPPLESSPLRQYAGNVTRGLLIVSLFLIVGARLYKTYLLKQEKPEERIKITARRSLSPKAQLIIAEVDGTEFLLTLTQEGVSLLTKLESKEVYYSELDARGFNSLEFSEELRLQKSQLGAAPK